ncbi:membrane hypothetical protein [Candidatus Zixiibacteriota bacterium]|nr:membrane hypothetical protein [candidate division Zixibacteria bacterium]
MEKISLIFGLRLLVFKRIIGSITITEWLKITVISALGLFLFWRGLGNVMAYLYKSLDTATADRVVWLALVQFGLLLILEGAISGVRKLYKTPENDFLLSFPISLGDLFVIRWMERLLVNSLFIVFGALVMIRQSSWSDVSWVTYLQLLTLVLFIHHTQFVIALLYSRRIPARFFPWLGIAIIIPAIAAFYLVRYIPAAFSWSIILATIILNLALLGSAVILRRLYAASMFSEYGIVTAVRYGRRFSYHRFLSRPGVNNPAKALLAKDIILLIRQWPYTQSVVTFILLIFVTAVLFAQAGNNALVIVASFGGFVIFSWSTLVFAFDKRQWAGFWMMRSAPLTGRQIWLSRFYLLLLMTIIAALLYLIPMVIGGCTVAQLTVSLVVLVAEAVAFSLLANGLLFVTLPHYRTGEYLFAIFTAIGIALGVSLPIILPPLLIIILIMNFRKGVERIETMEL